MKKLYEYMCKVEAFIARFFLMAMVTLIFVAGILRLLAHPINWTIDVATALFAWACFFSADIAWRANKLMSVDVFINILPEKLKKYSRMLNHFILTVFLLYLIGYGLWLSYTTRARTFQGIPNFSYTWVTLSVPIGAFFLLVTTILKIRQEIKVSQGGRRA